MGEFILNGRNYGGSIITPNPSDTPTDSLDSIKIDNTTYEIQGGGGGGSNLIIDAQRYSLEEQVVGIWTDGKPLYQKTLYSATTVIGASTNFFDLSALDIDEMVDWHGNFIRDGKNYSVDMVEKPSSSSANTYARCRYVPDTKQFAVNVADFSDYTTSFGRLYVTIQYTKTTDTAGSGGYQAYGFTPVIYSEEEREVGVWVDNKPLYQKTVVYSSGVNIGTSATTLSTANFPEYATIDKFISGFVNRETTNSKGTASTFLGVWKDGSNLKVYATTTWNGMTHFTFQYTKTTDVAGSGEYNTLAIPNVHYSTDEQVIGTWIDGKPLYQRTLQLTSGIVTGSFQTIPLDSTCIVNDYKGYVRRTDKRVDNFNGFVQTSDALLLSARVGGMEYFISTRFTDIVELCITIQYTKTTD